MSDKVLDPFDSATEAGERGNVFFGKLDVSAAFVKLTQSGKWQTCYKVCHRTSGKRL